MRRIAKRSEADVRMTPSAICSDGSREALTHRVRDHRQPLDESPAPPPCLASRSRRDLLGAGSSTYDVLPDGQRFLLIRAVSAEQTGGSPSIIVVQHFDEELKRLAPKK